MHFYTQSLAEILIHHADSGQAAGAKAYMRNQFEFFGIPAPLRRQLSKEYMRKGLPDYNTLNFIIKELWQMPQREFQYFAVELLAAYKNQWDEQLIKLIEYMITCKSWWDSVDHIASELTGHYFKKFASQIEPITSQWNRSENIWLQRSSIMFQKFYKKDTNTHLLSAYILHLADSQEFFIQKAIGWALREYSKTDPVWVTQFVKEHKLAPLSEREAVKRITNKII